MRIILGAILVSTLTISGCGTIRDSSFNPLNWFGKSRSTEVTSENENPLIPRRRASIFRKEQAPYQGSLVNQVTSLTVEKTTGGAIVKATGLPVRQGVFEVRLVPENEGEPVNNTLTFTLRALQPTSEPQGTTSSRSFAAGYFLSDQELLGIRTIVVQGAQNAQSVNRR